MDLEGIMQSEMSDRKRQILYDLTYTRNMKEASSQVHRIDWWLPEVEGGGVGKMVEGGQIYKLSVMK